MVCLNQSSDEDYVFQIGDKADDGTVVVSLGGIETYTD